MLIVVYIHVCLDLIVVNICVGIWSWYCMILMTKMWVCIIIIFIWVVELIHRVNIVCHWLPLCHRVYFLILRYINVLVSNICIWIVIKRTYWCFNLRYVVITIIMFEISKNPILTEILIIYLNIKIILIIILIFSLTNSMILNLIISFK